MSPNLEGVENAQPRAARRAFSEGGSRTGDTLVVTQQGPRPIAQIQPGDQVWAYDAELGDWTWKQVTHAHIHDHEGPLFVVHLADHELKVTPNHPFCVAEGTALETREVPADIGDDPITCGEGGRWVEAQDLRKGDILLGTEHSPSVTGISAYGASEPVYNLEVEGAHSYAVSAGGVLVHNKLLGRLLARGARTVSMSTAEAAKVHSQFVMRIGR